MGDIPRNELFSELRAMVYVQKFADNRLLAVFAGSCKGITAINKPEAGHGLFFAVSSPDQGPIFGWDRGQLLNFFPTEILAAFFEVAVRKQQTAGGKFDYLPGGNERFWVLVGHGKNSFFVQQNLPVINGAPKTLLTLVDPYLPGN